MAHICDIFPPRPGDPTDFLGSMNLEITPAGAVPAFDHGALTGSGDKGHYWSNALETKNPSGNPRQYAACNDKVFYVEDGTLTQDVDFEDVVQDILLFADNQTPPNVRLIAFFGNSTAIGANGGHAWRNLASDSGGGFSGAWTKHTGATAVQAWLARTFGPDAVLVTGASGAGRTRLGEHNLAKIVQGLYDGTTSNIGGAEPVGNGDWPVIGLAMLRHSVVAGTGAGAFARNTVDKLYEPIRPLQELHPHGLNTKAMASGENSVIYAMNDGRLYEWNGSVERDITPPTPVAKDAQRGRVSFIAHRGGVLAVGYSVANPFITAARAGALGVRFFTKIAGTWSEITSGVTDGALTTPASANMNGWGASAADRLLVLSPFPLWGIIPRVTRQPNSAVNSFTNPQGTARGGAETAGSLSVDLGGVVDTTILGTAGVSLALTGMPPGAAEPLLSWDAITAYADVGKAASVAIAGIAGSPFANMYAYEWSPTTTTGMTSTTTIDAIDVIPARPGLRLDDASGPFVQAQDFSSLAASQMLTCVYFGRPNGAGYDWSAPYALWMKGGGVLRAAWHTGPTGALTNGGQALLLYGRLQQFVIAEGQTRDPRQTRYPRLCQWTATEPGPQLALNNIVFRESNGQLADPARGKRIVRFIMEGEDIQPVDLLKPLVNYRTGRGWSKFPTVAGSSLVSAAPARVAGGGYAADVRILMHDANQTDLWAPLLTRVRIEWDYTDDVTQAPAETPAVD